MIDYNSIRSKYINADCGFYSVGNDIYFNKFQALLKATESKLPVLFHFNEPEYSTFAWQQEPTETLEELYVTRAREIRDTYDYIIAFYSGGIDSQNMIDTFVDNGIPLDHVVSYGSWNRHVDKLHNINNQEVMIAGSDTIKKIIQMGIKYTHLNMLDTIDKSFHDSEWILHSSSPVAPYTELLQHSTIKFLTKFLRPGKKVCLLWGIEKPTINLIEGTFYAEFSDRNLLDVIINSSNYPFKNVMFYCDKNTTKLMAKQIHKIINYLEENYTVKEISKILEFKGSERTQYVSSVTMTQYASYVSIVDKICYKKFPIFSVGKNISLICPMKWQWFWSDTSTRQFKIWNGAVIDLHKSVALNFKTIFDPVARRMTFCPFSNRYAIRKIKK
jgi:hypothetical protein